MIYKGFILDNFQIDAIKAIERNESVVVSAPTGSGKTVIADFIIDKDIKKGKRIIYTAPIKALSNQKYKEFSTEYGEDKIGIMTGDIVINPDAQVLIMTTEIYRNMVMTGDSSVKDISYVIFDEIHFINDIERGVVWEESIIFSPTSVRFICLSATIPNADEFARWIEKIKVHRTRVIMHNIRSVPLHKHFYDTELGITTLRDINDAKSAPEYHSVMQPRGKRQWRRPKISPPSHISLVREITDKTPALFFCFSRAMCEKNALELAQQRLFRGSPKIVPIIQKHLRNASPDVAKLESVQKLRHILPAGIGFHHAGLLPVIKEMVEELFSLGLLSVLYATETFAVGINMPAKTVCFESLRKYDGIGFRTLNSKEFFQIAGRAGRRGIDKEGFVYVMVHRQMLDYEKVKSITTKDREPIHSQFRLSVNTVLNLIKSHTPGEISSILHQSFFEFQKMHLKISITKRFENLKKKLKKLGYIEKDDILTEKGNFASRIFCDEMLFSEIFATEFKNELNEYQILLVIACLAYEEKERIRFSREYRTEFSIQLIKKIRQNMILAREKRFEFINMLSAMVYPIYDRKNFFDILKNTNMVEGDLIRFLSQILDRVGQLRKATTDRELLNKLDNCTYLLKENLKEISLL